MIAVDREGGTPALIARGTLGDFRCALGTVREVADAIVLDADSAKAIGAQEDGKVTYMARA